MNVYTPLLSKTTKTCPSRINIYAGFGRRMCVFQICAPRAVQKHVMLIDISGEGHLYILFWTRVIIYLQFTRVGHP